VPPPKRLGIHAVAALDLAVLIGMLRLDVPMVDARRATARRKVKENSEREHEFYVAGHDRGLDAAGDVGFGVLV
jgi:hypothetical protein